MLSVNYFRFLLSSLPVSTEQNWRMQIKRQPQEILPSVPAYLTVKKKNACRVQIIIY